VDLTWRTLELGGLPTLVLEGELDLGSVPAFSNAVTRFLGLERGRTVAIDLDGLGTIDDAGLGVLLGAAGRARENGGELVLVCSNARSVERFELSGLSRAIEVRSRLGS
jgi:anti-sigma B factor antagonist